MHIRERIMRFVTVATLCETTAPRRRRAHLMAPLAAALLALTACGEGGGVILTPGGGDNNPPACADNDPDCGQARIALTAATTEGNGDFLSYAVDVVSIKLEKANGGTVEALPNRQRVDFASLVDSTNLVSAASVPKGEYVGARIRLDYREAEVSVEVQGVPTAATVVDDAGNTLEIVDVEVALDDADRIVIAPGTPALFQLAFDLSATNTVNPLTSPVTVTAEPLLVASLEPVAEREVAVIGPLVSVDETAGSYVADLRPLTSSTVRNGEVTVLTDADTEFEVDGEVLDRADALAAMADLGEDTPTAAVGTLDTAAATFTASQVLAGGSVPGVDRDVVVGNVLSRDGTDLIVRGGSVIRTDDTVVYARGDIRVRLSSTTVVRKDGDDAALDIGAISVGQRISAFGDATSSDVDPTLDARAGRVRLHRTRLSGFVVDTDAGANEMRVDLFAIDGRNPAFFDFDGTGSNFATDADPTDYQVATSDLDLADFAADDPMRAFGFVTPFGAAPPDFDASTLVALGDLRALLGLGWGTGGTPDPFSAQGQSGFTVDATNPDLGLRHFLEVGPRRTDVAQLGSPLRVEPPDSGATLYAVSREGKTELFHDFGDWMTRVADLLRGGWRMRSLTARGSYDEDTTTLTADYVSTTFVRP
jgi:hypothetical protein